MYWVGLGVTGYGLRGYGVLYSSWYSEARTVERCSSSKRAYRVQVFTPLSQ